MVTGGGGGINSDERQGFRLLRYTRYVEFSLRIGFN